MKNIKPLYIGIALALIIGAYLYFKSRKKTVAPAAPAATAPATGGGVNIVPQGSVSNQAPAATQPVTQIVTNPPVLSGGSNTVAAGSTSGSISTVSPQAPAAGATSAPTAMSGASTGSTSGSISILPKSTTGGLAGKTLTEDYGGGASMVSFN